MQPEGGVCYPEPRPVKQDESIEVLLTRCVCGKNLAAIVDAV